MTTPQPERGLALPDNPDQARFKLRFAELQRQVIFDSRLDPFLTMNAGKYEVNPTAVGGLSEADADDIALWSERDHNNLVELAALILAEVPLTADTANQAELFKLAKQATDMAEGLRNLRNALQEDFPDLDEPDFVKVETGLGFAVGDPRGRAAGTPPPDAPPVIGGLGLPGDTGTPGADAAADLPPDEPDAAPEPTADDHGHPEAHDEADSATESTFFTKHFPRLAGILRHGKPIGLVKDHGVRVYNQRSPFQIIKKTPEDIAAEQAAAKKKAEKKHDKPHH